MSVNSPNARSNLRKSWLDITAITAWGILLLKYAIDGTLYILIHPSYYLLVTVTGVCLLLIGIFQSWRLYRGNIASSLELHSSLLPQGLTTMLLLGTAIAGLIITPKLFTSQAAVQRGISSDAVTVTRSQPQSFRAAVKPESKTLVDWVRTLNNYPEPDAYLGQKVNINGFVFYPKDLPANYLMLSRFVITCCAADAYPVALPVKFIGTRQNYPQDSWFQVKGKAIVETFSGSRQLVIEASEIKSIPTPKNPYQE
ncbi:TIGR03943 family putative permease subunit [Chamaesiphon sp. VAR_48_metabat_135_sub]|uniref:TIGR03943 family putative permease subunit n=1 Tax=Chamaesiphon sp. VAR_48_metabat_135_sub TaxID=2964699 RepID=UPI00286C35B4|nr:TIGR03943 family protein [Chamaesiphon sp. VAR_48_metabat_135_sub]